MATISDQTLDFLTLAATIDRGQDNAPHHIEWSRMTNRVAMVQVFTADRRRIVQTMTFWIHMLTKTEFHLIQWTDLLETTNYGLINRFAYSYEAA